MEINQDLPQFEESKSLLIVSGESKAKYYIAYDGHIELLDEFAVADPSLQLRDDYLKDSKTWKSWAMPEEYKQYSQHKLLKRISEETREIVQKHKIKETYLFCIEFMKNEVKDNLAPEVKETVKFEFSGDMQYHHPFDLLKLIKEKKEEIAKKSDISNPGF